MKRTVTIVGGGASALMLAAVLDPDRFAVTIYERNAALARKFLVASDGGFNLTNAEAAGAFVQRYTPPGFLSEAFGSFNNTDLIRWLAQLGIDTFTGSSGRVFPVKGTKPVDVLNAFLKRIDQRGVRIVNRTTWTGFSEDGRLAFDHGDTVESDITVFSLGGASWPVTGSHGEWLSYFEDRGVETVPFSASNCSVHLNWPQGFSEKAEGKALKNLTIRCGAELVMGEVVVTKSGLEGSGIYPLSPAIRAELAKNGRAEIRLDLKPGLNKETLMKKIGGKHGTLTLTERLIKNLRFDTVQLQLIKGSLSREEFTDVALLAERVKALPLMVTAMGPLEKAISSVGGISLRAVDEQFQIRALPGMYAIGEMLDYDAPTGGYLLQSCFSMGHYLGQWLNQHTF